MVQIFKILPSFNYNQHLWFSLKHLSCAQYTTFYLFKMVNSYVLLNLSVRVIKIDMYQSREEIQIKIKHFSSEYSFTSSTRMPLKPSIFIQFLLDKFVSILKTFTPFALLYNQNSNVLHRWVMQNTGNKCVFYNMNIPSLVN